MVVKHLAAAAAGLFVGKQVENMIEDRRNLRVRVIEDYIAKHPEDFPVTGEYTHRYWKSVLAGLDAI